MENRTKFNLNTSIQDWKSKLSSNPDMTIDNVEELESHLWEEITALQDSGLNEEEAFMIAQKRIGSIDIITTEFTKVNRLPYFSNRLLPYLRGILAYVAILGILECLLLALMSITKSDLNLLHLLKYHPIKFGVFLTIIFSIVSLIYFYFENKVPPLKHLTKIPGLIVTIIISRIFKFFMFPGLILILDHKGWSIIDASSKIFSSYIIIILAVVSLVIHFTTKRKSKLAITN